jgi:hypothetical protein
MIQPAVRKAVIEEHGGKCAECGKSDGPLDVDHILAKCLGGSDHIGNLQPLCKRCHREKTRRDLRLMVDADGRYCRACGGPVMRKEGVVYVLPREDRPLFWYHNACDEVMRRAGENPPIHHRPMTDPVREELLNDYAAVDPTSFIPNRDLFEWHLMKCRENGRDSLTSLVFGQRVSAAFPSSRLVRHKIGGRHLWTRAGIARVKM